MYDLWRHFSENAEKECVKDRYTNSTVKIRPVQHCAAIRALVNPAVSCHYFSPGPRLLSKPRSTT